MHCFTCGGNGFSDKVCPECKREPASLNLQAQTDLEIKQFVNKLDDIAVPMSYHGVVWSRAVLESNYPDLQKDKHFSRYVTQLEKIHNIFEKGKIPSKSAIIIAPPKFSKEIFAYSCMQFAIKHELSVARLIDTLDLKRLLVLSASNPKYKLYGTNGKGGVDYDEYITSDILFVTVTKTDYKTEASSIIMEIMGRRERLGLPTFFISRYQLNELVWPNKLAEFESIIDRNNTENSLKYPVLINYRKGFT